jgi:OOP family OmpA-OmpF porin
VAGKFGFLPKVGSGVAALLFLSACATFTAGPELQSLRESAPEGTAFSQALSREYLVLANFEADEMVDWRDAQRFTRKGLRAAKGEMVPPEDFMNWRIPAGEQATLAAARARLMAALGAGAPEAAPDNAAQAQAHFDCWVEQQEENWQTTHIATCRTGFETAMGTLEKVLADRGDPSLAMRQFAELSDSEVPPVFQLQFGFDSYLLDEDGKETVGRAAALILESGDNLTITGHADRAGPEGYNWTLSLQRATAVQSALVEKGIDAGKIRVRAAGEGEPLVATPDGEREPKNRRVEIRIRPRTNNVASLPQDDETTTVAATRLGFAPKR